MRIHLIRHGQSEWQLDQSLDRDTEMTSLGLKQSFYLNKHISKMMDNNKEDFKIYVSPLKRAIQTAQTLGREFFLDSRLIEARFHIAQCLPKIDTPQLYGRKLSQEITYRIFKKNLKETIKALIKQNRGENLYLYTHGGVIKTILRIIHDNDGVCYTINNCSVTTVKWFREKWHVEQLNDISFLPRNCIT